MAINNPYVPGDPYSYDLKWIVEELKTAIDLYTPISQEVQDLYDFVHGYFESTRFEAQLDAALRILAADGTLAQIIQPLFDAYKVDIDAEVNNMIARIDQQDDAIDVLVARMDTFASLPAGSTAGNAELLDIRVDYEGRTWPSAGDAVRSQATYLNTELTDVSDATTELIVGNSITHTNDETGTVWQYVSGVLTKRTDPGFAYFHVCTFPVSGNKHYRVTGCLYRPYTPICVFADSNGVPIDSSGLTSPGEIIPDYFRALRTIDVKTPEDCAFLYVNMINLALTPLVLELNYADTFDSSTAYVGNTKLSPSSVENGAVYRYINGGYEKNTSAAFGYWNIECFDVEGGSWYEVSGSQIVGVPVVVYLDMDGTVQGHDGFTALGYDAINTSLKIKTPNCAVKMAVNVFASGAAGIEALVYKCNALSSYYKRWAGKKWCVIGDSLTQSNATSIKKYHEFVSQFTEIAIENYGKGGTGFANPNGAEGNFVDRMATIPTDCDVYTIFGSFNDVVYGRTNNIDIGEATDSGTSTMCGYFNSAIDALYARVPLANIGIVAPCPWSTVNAVGTGANDVYGQNYVKALEEVCKRRCVPFLNLFEDAGFRPWDADWKLLVYTHDNNSGVHPNEIGHEILSTKFEAFLNELMH